nr:GNAT family N-acetyltransferase [Rhodococcus rhodnii]
MIRIRDARATDAAACADVYRPYVVDTAITFEDVPPTDAEMGERITRAQHRHAWLVAEDDGGTDGGGKIVGYAYAGPFKERVAYRWSCEVSVYLERGLRRTGAGRALYEALFARLEERGFLVAVAVITVPNEPSIGLHTALGFEPVGTFRRIGFKHGEWRDVEWMQRPLGAGPGSPTPAAPR